MLAFHCCTSHKACLIFPFPDLSSEGSVERLEGSGVNLVLPPGKKGFKNTLTAGVTYLPHAFSSSSSSSGGLSSQGRYVRFIPITDLHLLEEVYQGIVLAIHDEVLGEHKWEEIMSYT